MIALNIYPETFMASFIDQCHICLLFVLAVMTKFKPKYHLQPAHLLVHGWKSYFALSS